MRPAYRIETPRLVLRCWEPRDADLLGEAIVASLAHLRPWMPWVAGEPLPAEERVAKLRRWRAAFKNKTTMRLAVTANLAASGRDAAEHIPERTFKE